MKTEQELQSQYADMDSDAEPDTVDLIARLDVAYQSSRPPAHFIAETGKLLAERRRRTFVSLPTWRSVLRDRPLLGTATIILAVLLVTASVAYAANSIIHVWPPERGLRSDVVPIGNSLPPQSEQRYRTIDPARAARESGLPVAYLSYIPPALHGSVGVQLVEPVPWPEPQRTMPEQIRSTVRYRGSEHTLLVTLFELAPQVIEKHPVLVGEHTVHLPNGKDAWASVQPQEVVPSWVTMVRDGYLVSLYSDLPLSEVEQLATSVTVAPPLGDASTRGIPATWPTPLPADTPIPGVDIAVMGSVGRDLSSHPPRLTYFLKIGNRGTGHKENMMLTLVLPSGLSFGGDSPGSEHTIPSFGSGNGAVGGDLPLVITDPAAFDQGLDVRVTWTENGVRGERTFHLPFSPASDGPVK